MIENNIYILMYFYKQNAIVFLIRLSIKLTTTSFINEQAKLDSTLPFCKEKAKVRQSGKSILIVRLKFNDLERLYTPFQLKNIVDIISSLFTP